MSLEEVNKERAKIQGIKELGYWNKDMSWEHHDGDTDVKTGEMIEFRENRWECGKEQEF